MWNGSTATSFSLVMSKGNLRPIFSGRSRSIFGDCDFGDISEDGRKYFYGDCANHWDLLIKRPLCQNGVLHVSTCRTERKKNPEKSEALLKICFCVIGSPVVPMNPTGESWP